MTDMEYTLDERVVRKLPADPAVIAEELDELWDEVKANRLDRACAEAIQVAAMGIRFVVDMTRLGPERAWNLAPEVSE